MALADGETQPGEKECHEQLARILASGTFVAAPQLANFLRFVVTTTLQGYGDRLKGYTIGVEALGRSADFDPQTDPIVRVEAGRLRRALARYYAGSGRDDPLVIDLPRGTCVPTFRVRALPLGLRKYSFSARRQVFHAALRRWRVATRIVTAIALLSIFGNLSMAALLWWQGRLAGSVPVISVASGRAPAVAPPPYPLLYVEAFDVAGVTEDAARAIEKLRIRLRDALSLFDEIEVASARNAQAHPSTAASAPPRNIYRLAASAEQGTDGKLTLSLRLHEAIEGTIVWSESIEGLQISNATIATEKNVVRKLAPMLAQPYGVIYAREISKGATAGSDPRYRCIIEGFEFNRWNDSTQRGSVQSCLDETLANGPALAGTFSVLAMQQIRDYYGSGDNGALDRAAHSAQRAISLDPESARAHQVMIMCCLRGAMWPRRSKRAGRPSPATRGTRWCSPAMPSA
jgi:hypothetical protein